MPFKESKWGRLECIARLVCEKISPQAKVGAVREPPLQKLKEPKKLGNAARSGVLENTDFLDQRICRLFFYEYGLREAS